MVHFDGGVGDTLRPCGPLGTAGVMILSLKMACIMAAERLHIPRRAVGRKNEANISASGGVTGGFCAEPQFCEF